MAAVPSGTTNKRGHPPPLRRRNRAMTRRKPKRLQSKNMFRTTPSQRRRLRAVQSPAAEGRPAIKQHAQRRSTRARIRRSRRASRRSLRPRVEGDEQHRREHEPDDRHDCDEPGVSSALRKVLQVTPLWKLEIAPARECRSATRSSRRLRAWSTRSSSLRELRLVDPAFDVVSAQRLRAPLTFGITDACHLVPDRSSTRPTASPGCARVE